MSPDVWRTVTAFLLCVIAAGVVATGAAISYAADRILKNRRAKTRWTQSEVERLADALTEKSRLFDCANTSDIVRLVVADTILVCDGTLKISDFESKD